ncbi:hypothetical protein [Actinoplanes regularis]|nr:hypothetical protein [Actinoplanes regularis]GLW32260.1 hypothetical protein Areg01_51990 [Actinoplanes regularis]
MPAHRLLSERRYFSLGESLVDAAIGFVFGFAGALVAFIATLWIMAR